MWDFNNVIEISYQRDYVFKIVFDDGTNGEMDFSEFIAEWDIFKPLANLNLFKKAMIDGGTIAWENGADIAPETLYDKLENV